MATQYEINRERVWTVGSNTYPSQEKAIEAACNLAQTTPGTVVTVVPPSWVVKYTAS